MSYHTLCTRPTTLILNQYIKQDGVHLFGIQMVGQSGIQLAFENQTIWHLAFFRLFVNKLRSWVFRSPMYVFNRSSLKYKRFWQTPYMQLTNIKKKILSNLLAISIHVVGFLQLASIFLESRFHASS